MYRPTKSPYFKQAPRGSSTRPALELSRIMNLHKDKFPQVGDIAFLRAELERKLQEIDVVLAKVLEIQKGEQREFPTKEELLAIIEPLIPEPIVGQDGYTPIKNIDYFDGSVGAKGEKGDSIVGPIGPKGDSGKDAVADHETLVSAISQYLEEGKIKIQTKHIDGWQDANEVVRRFIAGGSIRGGGDTVKAGTGITITTDVNGNKVITGSASGTLVRDEIPAGSGTAFTLAHTPLANTLQLFRGGSRQSIANGDFTIVGTAITLTLTLASGETLTADYSY